MSTNKTIKIFKEKLGNVTNNNFSVNKEASILQDLQIDQSVEQEMEASFMNNVQNNIDTKNDTSIELQVRLHNEINFENIVCDEMWLGDIDMRNKAYVEADTRVKTTQKVSVETMIESSIVQTVEAQMPDMGQLMEKQKDELDSFYAGTKLDIDEVAAAAAKAASGAKASGLGNTTNNNTKISDKTNVESAIGISSDVVNKVQSSGENTMMNTISNSNKTEIKNVLKLENYVKFKDIKCSSFNVASISLENVLKAKIKNVVQNSFTADVIQSYSNSVKSVFSNSREKLIDEFGGDSFTNVGYENFETGDIGYEKFKTNRIKELNDIKEPNGSKTYSLITADQWKEGANTKTEPFYVSREVWEKGMSARGAMIDAIEVSSLLATACKTEHYDDVLKKVQKFYPDVLPKEECKSSSGGPPPGPPPPPAPASTPAPVPQGPKKDTSFLKKYSYVFIALGIIILLIIIYFIVSHFIADDDDDDEEDDEDDDDDAW